MTNVIVLNADYGYLETTCWKKAARLIVLELAEGVQAAGEQLIPFKIVRTVREQFLIPAVIKLKKYVKAVFRAKVPWKKHNIFIRDNYLCQYCALKVTDSTATIDHVIPRSKGGKNTFENTVTCCKACNQKKGDSTLKEARMFLKRKPFQPTIHELLEMTTRMNGVNATLKDFGLA